MSGDVPTPPVHQKPVFTKGPPVKKPRPPLTKKDKERLASKPKVYGRAACFGLCLWHSLMAPGAGASRGLSYGLRLAPKLSAILNLLTSYMVPAGYAILFSLIGLVAGLATLVVGFFETLGQLFSYTPYDYPKARAFIDWIPRVQK